MGVKINCILEQDDLIEFCSDYITYNRYKPQIFNMLQEASEQDYVKIFENVKQILKNKSIEVQTKFYILLMIKDVSKVIQKKQIFFNSIKIKLFKKFKQLSLLSNSDIDTKQNMISEVQSESNDQYIVKFWDLLNECLYNWKKNTFCNQQFQASFDEFFKNLNYEQLERDINPSDRKEYFIDKENNNLTNNQDKSNQQKLVKKFQIDIQLLEESYNKIINSASQVYKKKVEQLQQYMRDNQLEQYLQLEMQSGFVQRLQNFNQNNSIQYDRQFYQNYYQIMDECMQQMAKIDDNIEVQVGEQQRSKRITSSLKQRAPLNIPDNSNKDLSKSPINNRSASFFNQSSQKKKLF